MSGLRLSRRRRSILGASGESAENSVTFTVRVQGDTSPGIQAVWVVFTGKSGTPYHGTWQSLDLARPNADLYPTLWQGQLQLSQGASAQDILFMVQAVSGTGLTALATNHGAYYGVTDVLEPPLGQKSELALQSPPATTPYLRDISFTVLLTDPVERVPLRGQTVVLVVGGQAAQGVTDQNGRATITLRPNLAPGLYVAQAAFRGGAEYAGSTASSSFTVVKDTPTLTLASGAAAAGSLLPTSLEALVRDSAGRPLGEKSVVFVVSGNGRTLVRSVIADTGAARPSAPWLCRSASTR